MPIAILDFHEGIDASGLTGINGTQLNQLVAEAYPEVDRGMIVCTTDIGGYPDIPNTGTGYEKIKRYIWLRTDPVAYAVIAYVYNPNKANTLPAVGGPVPTFWSPLTDFILGVSSVTENNLSANSVTTTKIKDLNVTTGKIADLNVTTGKIAVGAVGATQMLGTNVAGQIPITNDSAVVAWTTPSSITKLSALADPGSGDLHKLIRVAAVTAGAPTYEYVAGADVVLMQRVWNRDTTVYNYTTFISAPDTVPASNASGLVEIAALRTGITPKITTGLNRILIRVTVPIGFTLLSTNPHYAFVGLYNGTGATNPIGACTIVQNSAAGYKQMVIAHFEVETMITVFTNFYVKVGFFRVGVLSLGDMRVNGINTSNLYSSSQASIEVEEYNV